MFCVLQKNKAKSYEIALIYFYYFQFLTFSYNNKLIKLVQYMHETLQLKIYKISKEEIKKF